MFVVLSLLIAIFGELASLRTPTGVLMTALAMIIGVIPMALAMGEGDEQNAPFGRAVIGGLTAATRATLFFVLFFVPTVFSVLYRYLARKGQIS